jgi:hypothetical protein
MIMPEPNPREPRATISDKTVAIATVVIALATLVNVGVAWKQWKEMDAAGRQTDQMLCLVQEQIAAANNLATAANTANANAVDADRPWVGPINAYVDGSSIAPGAISAHLSAVNAGRRPAKILRFRAAEKVLAHFPENPSFDQNSTPFRENSILIAVPNIGKMVSFHFVLNQQEYEDAIARKRRLYIYGIVDYEDVRVKGVKHTTKMCFFWTLTTNEFASCPEYNDAD